MSQLLYFEQFFVGKIKSQIFSNSNLILFQDQIYAFFFLKYFKQPLYSLNKKKLVKNRIWDHCIFFLQ